VIVSLIADSTVSVLVTTAIALAAGGISGWVAAAFRRREQRKERIREEVLRWANPILSAVSDLEARLSNILNDNLYLALDPNADEERPVDPDWAIGYEYTMESSLFLFAEYFSWTQLLKERLSFELFESQHAKDEFFKAVRNVSKALLSWPYERPLPEKKKAAAARKDAHTKKVEPDIDTQVFTLQQRAIGELMIERGADPPRVIGYPEFLSLRASDPRFEKVFEPLVVLLQDLKPGTKRWRRLSGTRDCVKALMPYCEELLAVNRTS
jgi:hypothetical protein